jgi:hypothetical protein
MNNEAAAIQCYAGGVRIAYRVRADLSSIRKLRCCGPSVYWDHLPFLVVWFLTDCAMPASPKYAQLGAVQRGRRWHKDSQCAEYMLVKLENTLHYHHRFKSRLVAARNITTSLPKLHLD